MEKIYVVASGEYSSYGIDAIFKNRDKAEAYCQCHGDCSIEEWGFSDDNIYTPFNAVRVQGCLWGREDRKPSILFVTRAKEDETFYDSNKTIMTSYGSFGNLLIIRKLPLEYDKAKMESKMEKIFYDTKAFIMNELTQYGDRPYVGDYTTRKRIDDTINKMLNAPLR